MMKNLVFTMATLMCFLGLGCASTGEDSQGWSRSGRPYKEAKPMNHRSLSSDSLYQACLRERSEVSCRNRLGR